MMERKLADILKEQAKAEQEAIAKAAQDNKITLPESIAKKYDVKPGSSRVFHSTTLGRTIDLNSITDADAEKLAKTGRLIKKNKDQAGS